MRVHFVCCAGDAAASTLPSRPAKALGWFVSANCDRISCTAPVKGILPFPTACRNPYLTTAPESRKVLYENGFLYDRSVC